MLKGIYAGIKEATPVCKYTGPFFGHFGFMVQDEWYVLGEFHGSEQNSMKGRIGEILGRPN